MAEQEQDGLDLTHPSGTAAVVIDGVRRRLRRPKVGEFRRLRELLQENQDEAYAMSNRLLGVQKAIDDSDTPENTARLEEARKLQRELNALTEDRNLAWVRQAVEVLSDSPLTLDDDDLPVWMASGETVTQLLQYWRTVPLAHGLR